VGTIAAVVTTDRTAAAVALLARFAERTGLLAPVDPPRRYLWTDAFAVCTLLGLRRVEPSFGPLALQLVDRVHEVLGRHRPDDARRGWISGLGEAEGRAHPTRGGLRIGKPLPERGPAERLEEQLEWDRDGQYFHYLTRWMHALARAAAATGERRYLDEAVELALVAHAKFTYVRPGFHRRLMHWKMSIDLTRPLVPSMGHHDPLDGLLAFLELRASLRRLVADAPAPASPLERAIAEMHEMGEGSDWTTDDALGIGGLMVGAGALAQWIARGDSTDLDLLVVLLRSSARGLFAFLRRGSLAQPPSRRLAFRELGLSIGLRAVPRIEDLARQQPARLGDPALQRCLAELRPHAALAERIEDCWLDPAHRAAPAFTVHLDINEVMLATSLCPDEYLAA
jgi:hypothetical protein